MSKAMRIGILGTGWGARVQIPAFREAGLEIVAIYGRNAEKTRSIAAEERVEAFESWRELVESTNIDLVSIVTPPHEHAEMAIEALRSGKHVLSEKPTAMNAAEAKRMVEEALRHPAALTLIDHELRFLPSWIEARRAVAELGGVRLIEVRFCSPGRGDRSREWTWWSDVAAGGGVLGAVGSHFIDAVRYLVGEVTDARSSLSTVIAERPFRGAQRTVTSDDFATLELRTTTGAIAVMSLSVVSSADEPTMITIHGERGGIRLLHRELWRSHGKRFELVMRDDGEDRVGDSPGGPFGSGTLLLGRALRAYASGDPAAISPAATFHDGLRQQQTLDAARRSHESGGIWTAVD